MKRKTQNVIGIVLKTIGVVGVISMAILAPNALQIFSPKTKKRNRFYVPNTITNLAERGYIRFEKTKRGTFVRLTEKGRAKLKQIELQEYQIPKPKKWDKRYRIIIFDIREYQRGVRNKLRRTLEGVGFVKLQNSVWVYPYECRELIILLKASFKIGKDILYMEASSIENDGWIKKHFGLHK